MQHAGVFLGMVFVSIICSGRFSQKNWFVKPLDNNRMYAFLSCSPNNRYFGLRSYNHTPSKYCDLRRVQWDIFNCSNRANDATGKRGRKRRYSNVLGCLTSYCLCTSLSWALFCDLFGYLFQSAREGYATVMDLDIGLAVFIFKTKICKTKKR